MVPDSSQLVKSSSVRFFKSARKLGSVPVILPLLIAMVLRSEKYPISSGIDPLRPLLAEIGEKMKHLNHEGIHNLWLCHPAFLTYTCSKPCLPLMLNCK